MGSHWVDLPEVKFSGQEDVREFLRDFGIYVAVNEWKDLKAGQYLAACVFERWRESLLSPTVWDSEEKFQGIFEGSEAEIWGMTGLVEVEERL